MHRVSFTVASLAFIAIVTTAAGAARAGSARPDVDSMDDIQQWYGEGSNEAALVLDWNDGKSPQALAWGYRFDGSATAEDMFTDIVTQNQRLYAKVGTPSGAGLPVYGIGLDVDADGFSITDGTTFTSDGLATTSASDGASPNDVDDHYEEGFFTEGFWSHYVNTAGNPYGAGSWTFGGGISAQTLSDGSWAGLSYAPAFDFTAPSDAVAAVPTPSAALAGVTLLGGMLLCRQRRSARHTTRR